MDVTGHENVVRAQPNQVGTTLSELAVAPLLFGRHHAVVVPGRLKVSGEFFGVKVVVYNVDRRVVSVR